MKKYFLIFALILLGRLELNSAGLIIVHSPDFWEERKIIPPIPHLPPPPIPPLPRPWFPPRPWAPLEINHTKIDAAIENQSATTVIEQEFYNPNPRQLEGTFILPVPKGAVLSKFSMEIDGKKVYAELLDSEKARKLYEEIVGKLKDPALLEFAGRDLYKARIFPIEPHSRKRISISYTHIIKSDSGLFGYILPLSTEKYSPAPVKQFELNLTVKSSLPIKTIYSPTHKVDIKRDGKSKVNISYLAGNFVPENDFQLYFSDEESDFDLKLLTHKRENEDGFFLLFVTPDIEVRRNKLLPKDIVFVLDTSGSMAGAKLDQAKRALFFCVSNLNDTDRFEIIRFATDTEQLFGKLSEATKSNRQRAEKFISDLKPLGGTAIDDALRAALAIRSDDNKRLFFVVFITDGRPTVGVTEEDQIIANIKKNNKLGTRIFCFGIGTDVNTRLLDSISAETRSHTQYVLAEEDLEVKISSFFVKIQEPVLANLTIKFPEKIRISKVYPSPLPDLFRGDQLILAGRYSESGDGKIEIEGTSAEEKKSFSYDAKFPKESLEHDFIPRLWAMRRVGFLLDEIRLNGESKELKEEVIALARKYGIITPYTAYLIMEDETRREVPVTVRVLPVPKMRNVELQNQLQAAYREFNTARSGDFAVAGARSFRSLKMADSVSVGLQEGTGEMARVLQPDVFSELFGGAVEVKPSQEPKGSVASQFSTLRHIQGKTFYLNSGKWIDSDIDYSRNYERKKIKFGSDEYFEFLKNNPSAAPWLAAGSNIELLLNKVVYEIYE